MADVTAFPGGRRTRALGSTLDIVPTLLELADVTAEQIFSARNCTEPAIRARPGANVMLRRNTWTEFDTWALNDNDATVIPGVPLAPAVEGLDAGNLSIEESRFFLNKEDGFIYWDGQPGSQVNILPWRSFSDSSSSNSRTPQRSSLRRYFA